MIPAFRALPRSYPFDPETEKLRTWSLKRSIQAGLDGAVCRQAISQDRLLQKPRNCGQGINPLHRPPYNGSGAYLKRFPFLDRCNDQWFHIPMASAKADLQRLVIIGNSGSGKSHLARELSKRLDSNVIHLDQLFWEPGGFEKKRPAEVVHSEVKHLSMNNAWIVEGVFGDLAATALENATALIFLNKDWAECEAALKERGSESSKQLDPVQAEKNFQELLIWAKAYVERENSRSLAGHTKLFSGFHKTKFEFQNRSEIDTWLKQI